MPVALDGEQAVALHPGDRLADRGAALVQALGDPGAQRRHAFLFELEDGAQVHLGGVDEIIHGAVLPAAILPRQPGVDRRADAGGSRDPDRRCPRRTVSHPSDDGAAGRSTGVAWQHGGMADRTTAVVWDEALLDYDMGDHPLNPVRVELTMALARELGVLDRPGVRMVAPEPADEADADPGPPPRLPRRGPAGPARPVLLRLGPQHPRQPGLRRACTRRRARICGATIAAAEAVWHGAARPGR